MAHNVDLPQAAPASPTGGMVTLTHVLYAMHGFSALMGMLGPMFVVTAFLTGWPSIIAVIVNYVKRSDARGTYVYSHYSWQLRTFWWASLWLAVIVVFVLGGAALSAVTVFAFLTERVPVPGLFAGIFVMAITQGALIAVGVWVLYHIIRGWITLANGSPMPAPN